MCRAELKSRVQIAGLIKCNSGPQEKHKSRKARTWLSKPGSQYLRQYKGTTKILLFFRCAWPGWRYRNLFGACSARGSRSAAGCKKSKIGVKLCHWSGRCGLVKTRQNSGCSRIILQGAGIWGWWWYPRKVDGVEWRQGSAANLSEPRECPKSLRHHHVPPTSSHVSRVSQLLLSLSTPQYD